MGIKLTEPFHFNETTGWTLNKIHGGNWFGKTVVIGGQTWMAENLNVTHYRDGSPIQNEVVGSAWGNDTEGAYGVYGDDPFSNLVCGKLYNWHAVNNIRGLAPYGWHIPTDDEWTTLEDYLDSSEDGSMLAGRRELWDSGDLENNSEFGTSGFNGLPAGYRNASNGNYLNMGNLGYFWSSSETTSTHAWTRRLSYNNSYVYRSYHSKRYGFSIRCIKD